jgi:hypothetical protein
MPCKLPYLAETARFWRLNTIEALKMMDMNEREAQDPEQLTAIKANKEELAGLLSVPLSRGH